MFLVHVRLLPHPLGDPLPEYVAALMAAPDPTTEGVGRVEHISLHPRAAPGPVIGVYVHARDPAAAEWVAVDAWRRSVTREPALHAWELTSPEVFPMRPGHDG